MKELASAFTRSLFTFLLQPPPLLPHIEFLPISRIPMAVHFLTSAPWSTLGVGHNSNAPQGFAVKTSIYYMLYLAAVQRPAPTDGLFPVTPTPFAAPPPPFNRKTERSSRAAVALFLCLLFSWHKQSPLTLCCHFVKHRWQTEASHSIVKHAWADSFWTLQTRVGMSLQNIWLRSENPNDALDKSNRSLCFLIIKPSRWIG